MATDCAPIEWTRGRRVTVAVFALTGHFLGAGLLLKNGSKIVKPFILVVLGLGALSWFLVLSPRLSKADEIAAQVEQEESRGRRGVGQDRMRIFHAVMLETAASP